MTIIAKLRTIQQELKAPKGQTNTFGGYKYRSCEDILEAVKPLLDKNKVALLIKDEMLQVGDRYYVKATATLIDEADGGEVWATALAREEETKKGMDASQITGAASSYARKYALNGLFAIDDEKDADTRDNSTKAAKKTKGIANMPADEKPLSYKVCPFCKAEHTGQYPKCIECYKKEKAGATLEKAIPVLDNSGQPF